MPEKLYLDLTLKYQESESTAIKMVLQSPFM